MFDLPAARASEQLAKDSREPDELSPIGRAVARAGRLDEEPPDEDEPPP